jgi:hypothetical protein
MSMDVVCSGYTLKVARRVAGQLIPYPAGTTANILLLVNKYACAIIEISGR